MKISFNQRIFFSAILSVFFLSMAGLLLAQELSDTARDQKEAGIEELRGQTDEYLKPKTVDEVVAFLKERAAELKKEKRLKELLKTKMSAGFTYGVETNPANNSLQKGDQFGQEDFSFNWQPAFMKKFTGDFGYRLSEQSYFEQSSLDTFDHTLSASFKYTPFADGKLTLTPLFEYDWLIYPYDANSSYEQTRLSLDIKHYISKVWNWGGKYEYSYKAYDKKAARDTDKNNLNLHRSDYRDSIEVWVKRFFGKYSITLKEKTYRNNSNDEYQKYYDFDSHRGYFTVSRSFLKNNKLYLTYTSDYEIKAYKDRLADERIGRHDQIIEHKMNAYYTLKKPFTLSSSVTYKKSGSNDATGVFKDVTFKTGLTADF